jgi:hypothetical protein
MLDATNVYGGMNLVTKAAAPACSAQARAGLFLQTLDMIAANWGWMRWGVRIIAIPYMLDKSMPAASGDDGSIIRALLHNRERSETDYRFLYHRS